MTEPNQVADSTDARQASMSRVVTQETLMASLTAKPASEAPAEPAETDKPAEGEKPKAKHSAQERISELANKRREAEEKAEVERKRADGLEERLRVLESGAAPVEQTSRPKREAFSDDEAFIEALADWKANENIAKREQQQREDRIKREADQIDRAFQARAEKAATDIEDFQEVVSSAEVDIPNFLVMAIKESEVGPLLTYYLAKHQDEARKIAAMRPVQALKSLMSIEAALTDDEPEPEKTVAKVSSPAKPRAPEPIAPVRGSPASDPGPAKSFDEYRARRKAERARG